MSVTHGNLAQSHRWVFPLACAAAVSIVLVTFPFSSLFRQQGELNTTSSQIALLHQQSLALQREARAVSSRAAAIALAREQYQLVEPGQGLIQVLPGAGSGYVSSSAGDPGLQPLVAPASATLPSLGTGTNAASPGHATNGFFTRFVRTLEFWR